MPRGLADRNIVLSFPPFTRVVKWLIGINLGIYLLLLVLQASRLGDAAGSFIGWFGLIPALVVSKGYIWQVVTYAFVHLQFLHFLFNMFALWMFGSQIEQTWGTRRFVHLYGYSILGAALVTVAVSYSGQLGLAPTFPTIGASGGVYGILLAFGMTFPESEIMMFPLPLTIKAKYFVAVLILLALISSLSEASGVAYVAHLGGLVSAFVYIKLVHQRGRSYATTAGRYVGRGLSDRAWIPPREPKKPSLIARARDSYYRWKRRRAAKKFEVYMRKHDRHVYFDEHGNYIPYEEPKKKDNGEDKEPWVN
jgi:membrane associated rhomboid family serine protease